MVADRKLDRKYNERVITGIESRFRETNRANRGLCKGIPRGRTWLRTHSLRGIWQPVGAASPTGCSDRFMDKSRPPRGSVVQYANTTTNRPGSHESLSR
jgi:hypothetical protein